MFYSIIYLWEIIYSAASPVSLILDCSWWRWCCSPLLPLWAQHSATCCRFVFEWLSSSRRISTAGGRAAVDSYSPRCSSSPICMTCGSLLGKQLNEIQDHNNSNSSLAKEPGHDTGRVAAKQVSEVSEDWSAWEWEDCMNEWMNGTSPYNRWN